MDLEILSPDGVVRVKRLLYYLIIVLMHRCWGAAR
jgi:hypothetical protein